MGNPRKGLTIPMLFKTLRSIFVAKRFHHLSWSKRSTKQRTELISSVATEIDFCWPTLKNNCYGLVFNCLPQFFYKDKEQNWLILCCSFLLRTCSRSLLTISITKFRGLDLRKSINNFHIRKKGYQYFFEFIYYLIIVLITDFDNGFWKVSPNIQYLFGNFLSSLPINKKCISLYLFCLLLNCMPELIFSREYFSITFTKTQNYI